MLRFAFLLLYSATMLAQKEEKKPALTGLDPVELTGGKEVKGDPAIVVDRGRYRYAFASEANRKTFQKDPERYSIQFGGACMRMGPLSGGGSTDLYHVHDGRIYTFASKTCRKAFVADPVKFIDRADEEPKGTDAAVQKGQDLLKKAVQGIGGEKALKDLTTIQFEYEITAKQGDQVSKSKRLIAISFPLSITQVDDYGNYRSVWILLGDKGYLSWEKGDPVDDDVRHYMLRQFYRQPITLLKAWQAAEAKAVHLGSGKVGETPAENVALAVKGATATLSIDPATGRILRVAYRDRTGAGIAEIEKDFSDFRDTQGLNVPFGLTSRVDGKKVEATTVITKSIRVNEKIDPALLKRPE